LKERAITIADQVKKAVSHWGEVATKYGISKTNQELKAPAFHGIQ